MPLDPWTWIALQRCLDERKRLGSNNSHVLITMQTKATRVLASDGYLKNTLCAVGIQPRILRSTRLVGDAARVRLNHISTAMVFLRDLSAGR